MKLLHIGDLHIGKKFKDVILLEDQRKVLEQIVDISKKEKVDGVMICGDIYDKNNPSNEAIELFNDFITKLYMLHKKIFVIAGNHDSHIKISFLSYLLRKNNLFVSEKFSGTTQVISLNDKYGPINIHLLPFVKPYSVKQIYPNEKIQTYQDAVSVIINNSNIDKSQRNVLICHQFITNSELSDSEELAVGGLDNIDYTVFDDFDYVALGHIHKPQSIGRDTLRYSGSILKYSFSEINHVKSCSIVELFEKGNISVKTIPLTQAYDVREIRGYYDDIIKMPYSLDYVRINIEDEIVPIDARYNILMVFPNMVKLVLASERVNDDRNVDVYEDIKATSIIDLFVDFYKMQNNNVEPSNEHKEIVESILKELEDIH